MNSEAETQYTVLARRFRPQAFEDVVGQEHVATAIKNAIKTNRVAHAYLFTGARGVGKTSTARIFAKALNCPQVKDGVPCNACEICDSIGTGGDVDVIEIDGASNRRIEDIRDIRANVGVRSMRSQYKVYIIDEVHMLTREAFNALLKTLEEPPPNVKFVFCTTEPNKVPDTILSRCQRFDFGTIAQGSIVTRLKQIAEAEGKQVEDAAVELVARRAAGSMRDSQSLFDQLLAFGGELITADDVNQLLGTAPDERLIELVDALINRDQATALEFIDQALLQGVQIGSLSDQLLAYLRDLLVTAAGANAVSLTSVSDGHRPRLKAQSDNWGMATIAAAMQILTETKGKMQRVNYGRALVELAIVRISLLEDLSSIASLVATVASGQPIAASVSPTGRPAVKKNVEYRPRAVATVNSPENGTASEQNSPPVDETQPVTQKQDKTIHLSAETLDEIWQRILPLVPEILAGHLLNSSHRAISGPNLVEIVFPKSYLFSKSYCERSETSYRLETVTEEITGTPLKFSCSVDASSAEPVRPKTPEQKDEPQRRNKSIVDDDEFVQQAVNIFSGQLVEVRTVHTPIETTDPESELEPQEETEHV